MRGPAALVGVVAMGVILPAAAEAQGIRGTVRVRGNVVELRGLTRDSLPEAEVEGEDLRRELPDGTVVTCVPDDFCRWLPGGDEETVGYVTQDVSFATWPGIRGLSGHVHLRGRAGSEDLWPRTDQEVEAITAYVSYDHSLFRARGGRLQRTNGLGYYNFDGGALLWRGFDPLRVEAYGGYSLAPNLNAPRDGDLLGDADEFAPDERGVLFGVDVSARWGRKVAGTFTYQREIRDDRLALYTERVSGDVRATVDRFTIDAAVDYDLGFGEFNEARVRVTAPVVSGTWVTGEVRRYLPFFELWTIWGAFAPVGFDEFRVTGGWEVPGTALSLEGGGAWRSYEETDAGAEFAALEEDGWRGFGRARWRRDGWFVEGGYRAEFGSGAARYGGDLSIGRTFSRGTWIALRGTSTQQFSEFRLGGQTTTGGGIDGGIEVGEFSVQGGLAQYSLTFDDRPSVSNWTQLRAHLGIGYRFGDEPGLSSVGRGYP